MRKETISKRIVKSLTPIKNKEGKEREKVARQSYDHFKHKDVFSPKEIDYAISALKKGQSFSKVADNVLKAREFNKKK